MEATHATYAPISGNFTFTWQNSKNIIAMVDEDGSEGEATSEDVMDADDQDQDI